MRLIHIYFLRKQQKFFNSSVSKKATEILGAKKAPRGGNGF